MLWPLYLAVPIIAFLYASVGFGGATGYLAVMSLFGISPKVMASTALILNVLVSAISFSSFYRAGHLRPKLLLPFLITSVPAAFLGGYFKIDDTTYLALLYAVLAYVAIRLLFFSHPSDDKHPLQTLPTVWALVIGLGIGLLSGIVGIGGGIFLSPIIIFARWGTSKQASAVAAAFIFLNSLGGLVGRLWGGTLVLDGFTLSLLPFGLIGALTGSYWGAMRLSGLTLRRVLGLVMAAAVANFWWTIGK
ncbi:MAG: hypothetical protein DDG60_07075 [Anaerolineae bacterium]|nr:MAG: hypothetical protein DDG60_07075 [Anaerolineae bacterium]